MVFVNLLYLTFFPTYIFSDKPNLGQAILFLSFPVFVFFQVGFRDFKLKMNSIILVFWIVGAVLVFTSISKFSFISFNMMMNHVRILVYSIVIALSYSLFEKYEVSHYDLKKALKLLVIPVFIFVLFQFILPGNPIEHAITRKPAFDYTGFRIGGPFDWSYVCSFVLLPIFFISLNDLLSKFSLYDFFVFLVSFVFIVLSQSKSAYLALVVGMFIYLLVNVFYSKYVGRLILFLSLGSLLLFSYVVSNAEDFHHLFNFFENVSRGTVDGSTLTRLRQISISLDLLSNNYFFGYPKLDMVIENSYFYYLYYHGFVGLLAYLFFVLSMIFFSFRGLRNSVDNRSLQIGILILCCSIVFFGASASITDANKSSYFLYFILGGYMSILNRGRVQ